MHKKLRQLVELAGLMRRELVRGQSLGYLSVIVKLLFWLAGLDVFATADL
jgi:hypothetical protein